MHPKCRETFSFGRTVHLVFRPYTFIFFTMYHKCLRFFLKTMHPNCRETFSFWRTVQLVTRPYTCLQRNILFLMYCPTCYQTIHMSAEKHSLFDVLSNMLPDHTHLSRKTFTSWRTVQPVTRPLYEFLQRNILFLKYCPTCYQTIQISAKKHSLFDVLLNLFTRPYIFLQRNIIFHCPTCYQTIHISEEKHSLFDVLSNLLPDHTNFCRETCFFFFFFFLFIYFFFCWRTVQLVTRPYIFLQRNILFLTSFKACFETIHKPTLATNTN